jgi:hypothetical protein
MRPLSIKEILHWADVYHDATGKWPNRKLGAIASTLFETWAQVDEALRCGRRGLPGGSSLAQLLVEQRGVRNVHHLPPLTEAQILAWADAHQRRTGSWPRPGSGGIPDSDGERWSAVEMALTLGRRSLPGRTSLARLLAARRGVRNQPTALTVSQILLWADQHHQRTGAWPRVSSGRIQDAPGETWSAVASALQRGCRGLPGGSSLARLLAEERGARNCKDLADLSVSEILAWADAYQQRTGRWPKKQSGPVDEAQGETWSAIDSALSNGRRGLPGGSSLPALLAEHRGVHHHMDLPRYTRKQILAWADAHRRRTGSFPTRHAGSILEAPEETWHTVNSALIKGSRGLPGGSSLARLLAEHRGKRNHKDLPPLWIKQILAWADSHHQRTAQWPNRHSGPIFEAPDETWVKVDNALRQGGRGQPGGSSLARLLARKRGVRNPQGLPPLVLEQILAWADAYRERTGKYPTTQSGAVAEEPGENWSGINVALKLGRRGLAGGYSLARLLQEQRGG